MAKTSFSARGSSRTRRYVCASAWTQCVVACDGLVSLPSHWQPGDAGGRGSKGKYEWRTYEQIEDEVLECANGLETLGFAAGSGIAMFLKNRKEYVAVELASYALGGFNTSVYDILGSER